MKRVFALVILLILLGCDGEFAQNDLPHSKNSKSYDSFSIDETLIKVGDRKYIKSDCERDAALTEALRSRVSQLHFGEVSLKDKEIACGNFIVAASIRDRIEKQKLNLNYQVDSNKLIRLRRRLGKKNAKLVPSLELKLEREAEVSAYIEHVLSDSIYVTSNEVDYIHQKIKRYNEIAVQTNALVHARATNVWQQVISTGEFEKCASKYDERPDHGGPGEWGVFDASLLENDGELLSVIRKTPVGGITPPVEADGGLLIIKVVEKTGLGPKVDINTNPEKYELKRIFFQLPVFYKTETYEETYKNILKHKKMMRSREIIDEVLKSAKVEYPNGLILWK